MSHRFCPFPPLLVLGLVAACGDGGPRTVGEVVDDAMQTANEAVGEALTDAGLGEQVDFELTLERAAAWREAADRIGELDREDRDEIDLRGDNAIVELQAALEEDPRVVDAIEDAGLTTREFAILSVLLPQALVVHETRKQGVNLSLPMVTDEHLDFVADNEAELRRILRDDG